MLLLKTSKQTNKNPPTRSSPLQTLFLLRRPVIGPRRVVYFLLPQAPSLHQFHIPQHLSVPETWQVVCAVIFRGASGYDQQRLPRSVCAGSLTRWHICLVYNSLALPRQHPLLQGRGSRDPGCFLRAPPLPGGCLLTRHCVVLGEATGKVGFASRWLDAEEGGQHWRVRGFGGAGEQGSAHSLLTYSPS